jgi:hypothetical protein
MDSRILPELFSTMYEVLYARGLHDGTMGEGHPLSGVGAEVEIADGKPVHQARTSTSQITSIGKKTGPKKASTKRVGKTARTMREERMWKYRQKVDKRLRKIAREIADVLEGQPERLAAVRRCTGKCQRFGDDEWKYCAHCGGPMREVDSSD